MELSGYTALARQSGLMREMSVIANNVANMSTTGFRQENVLFSEFLYNSSNSVSQSVAAARSRHTSFEQGAIVQTGGQYDFAIEGNGFFQIQSGDEIRLTRAGSFLTNAQGDLVTPNGDFVLDLGGAPVFIPPDVQTISVAADGTMSADGQILGQLGLVVPDDPLMMTRADGVTFASTGNLLPATDAQIRQGFIERSNVSPVSQMARMIEVQRAYEMGQSFLDAEDERVRNALDAFVR